MKTYKHFNKIFIFNKTLIMYQKSLSNYFTENFTSILFKVGIICLL